MTRTWDINTHHHVDLPGSEQGVAVIPRTLPPMPVASPPDSPWWTVETNNPMWANTQRLEVVTYSGVRAFRLQSEIASAATRAEIAYARPVDPLEPEQDTDFAWMSVARLKELPAFTQVKVDVLRYDGARESTTLVELREIVKGVAIFRWRFTLVPALAAQDAVDVDLLSEAITDEDREDIAEEARHAENSGHHVNYYLAQVDAPTKGGMPYRAECMDVIDALDMTFAEGEAFKAIWRCAAARLGMQKAGNEAVRDAQKVIFYGERMLSREKRRDES